jgi:hypothetical protein
MKLRPLNNKFIRKNWKVGVTLELVGGAELSLHHSICFIEYYRFDLSFLVFIKLRPLKNELRKNRKRGVSLEPGGVALQFLHQWICLWEYYRFDSSPDFYNHSASLVHINLCFGYYSIDIMMCYHSWLIH